MKTKSLADSKVILEAVPFSGVSYASQVYNISQITEYVHIKLPDWAYHSEILKIEEVSEYPTNPVNLIDVRKIPGHPWIDILFEALDDDPGYHIYKIEFRDLVTEDASLLYFAYNLQVDDPEKPYIYMHREEI